MLRRAVLAGVRLAFAAAGAPAAERIADPTCEFVDGYDPSQNDFFANTPERTVLLRIRDDLDGDGVADLALSESSTWGNAGGQWLLFRGEPGGGYAYWGTLFFSPGSAAIGPRPGELTAYVPVGATRGSLQVHRLTAGGITLRRRPGARSREPRRSGGLRRRAQGRAAGRDRALPAPRVPA